MKYILPFILLIAACSQPAPVARIAQTPSGYPEAVFSGISAQKLANKIAARCVERGHIVLNNSPTQVKCDQKLEQRDIVGANAYAFIKSGKAVRDIHVYAQYSLTKINGDIRVQSRTWKQFEMPYGRIEKLTLNDPERFNHVTQLLYSMGGKPV